MRIATGCIVHESDSFTDGLTRFEDFTYKPLPLLYGADVYADAQWMKNTSAGGIMETLREEGVEVLPTLFGKAFPYGLIETEAYLRLKKEMVDRIRAAEPLDGICLELHGSMCAQGYDDPEGDLLRALREEVGPDVPIISTLDMHATVTAAMVQSANGLVGYHTAPHVDKYETGVKAARILLKSLRDNIPLAMEWVPLPMLLGGEQSETAVSPMRDLIAASEEVERLDGILAATYSLGFPWADSPYSSICVLVLGEARVRDTVQKSARMLAREFWERRRDFTFTTEAYKPEEALRKALEEPKKPVVIADSGDNCTAGAAQNMTLILQKMLAMKMDRALFVAVVDPPALQACTKAGEGSVLDLRLGRVEPIPNGAPLMMQACVQKLGITYGIKSAVIDIKGITVVIIEKRSTEAVYDPAFLTDLGLKTGDYQTIVVKSGYLSPAYQKVAARKMLALTPGDTNQIFSELPFERAPRPIFPLDQETTWSV